MLQQGQDELDAIELQLQQLLQTRDQLAASRTVLLREQGPSGLARSPTHLQDSNRLQGPDPAAPHLALHPGSALGSTVHPASAASHPGLVPQPRANALQSYMVLHQEQQQRHQLCMQYVSQNAAARGGSLIRAAQGKLYELLRLQKLQVGLHEELLHNLVACATLNSSSSSGGGGCVGM
ncbi:hypothetical protein OEZ85_008861 [Tetradesmus obliquus]|uniref:SMARCC C-terminal domain-containing protein n=1 Tax=Tetradesmus obliquus TaxID=3088 RepID=A0ABY8TK98_TETOB|nr:hypothetical protein OEZ85_008861 [Tetradesmus obliquus]